MPAPDRNANERPKRWPKGIKRWPWKQIFKYGAILAGVMFVIGTIVVAVISKDLPDPNKLSQRKVAQSTKIYDRTGTHLLYEAYQDEKRTLVTIDQISPWALKATIAIEDRNFYNHGGIQPLSILRAAVSDILGRKTGGGGASTLTQQLIKNTIVGNEHSLWRKIKEAILAIRLEKKYSKDQILQLYLNEISYGGTNYGIEAASQTYFHKNAKDLDIDEAGTLAALVQAPSRYLNDLIALRARRDTVIRLMYDQGYITLEQKNQAQNVALRLYRSGNLKDAPHFVMYVEQLLTDQFGKQTVDTDGLKVITTLDYDKQKKAEQVVKDNGDKFAKEANANNAALVAIDPHNGQILSYVGSRDYNNPDINGMFDVAGFGKRQPGSSFKPFVYSYAFLKGYTPETVMYDDTINFELRPGATPYAPKNYDGQEHGLVTLRKSLQGSLNIPAVKLLYLVGPSNVIDYARGLGYTTFGDSNLYGLSLVLGGAEVNLLEHTAAYATMANNGVYNKPVSILKITNDKNETLYEWKETDGTKAVEPEVAATLSNVLSDNNARAYVFGAVNNLTLPDRPVAAKTGTTNDSKDVWTMGYVPSLAVGVWVGNTTPATMKGTSSKLAGLIWNQYLRAALVSTTPEQFPTPPGNDAIKPVLRGSDGGIKLPINRINGKIATSSTPDALKEIHTYLPPHDILYYVIKDDPRGPAPADPSTDEQYQNWEDALQAYVQRERDKGNYLELSEPPSEYDTGTNPELAPTVSFVTPTNGSDVASANLTAQVNAVSPRGVASVSYTLDGKNVGTVSTFPFTLNFTMRHVIKGLHTLAATAIDDEGNAGTASITINVTTDSDPPQASWVEQSPLQLTNTVFPHDLHLNTYRWPDIKDVKIYLTSAGKKKLIYTFVNGQDNPTNDQLTLTWQHKPAAGHSLLEAVTTNKDGTTESSLLDVDVN